MLSKTEIAQVQDEYESAEMSDQSQGQLDRDRMHLYHKWFAKLLDHAQGRDQKAWLEGVREDNKAMRDVIG